MCRVPSLEGDIGMGHCEGSIGWRQAEIRCGTHISKGRNKYAVWQKKVSEILLNEPIDYPRTLLYFFKSPSLSSPSFEWHGLSYRPHAQRGSFEGTCSRQMG